MKLPKTLRSEMGHTTIFVHGRFAGQLRLFEFMGVHSWEDYGFLMGKIWVFDLKPILPGKIPSGSG